MATQMEMDAWVVDAIGVNPGNFQGAPAAGAAKGVAAPAAGPKAGSPPPASGAAAKAAPHDAEQLANTQKDARNLVAALRDFAKFFAGKNGDIATLACQDLTAKLAVVDKQGDSKKRIDAYMAISAAATRLYAKFGTASKNAGALDRQTESIFLRGNKLNTPASDADLIKVNADWDGLKTKSATIDDYIAGQEALRRSMDALSVKFDGQQAVGSDAAKLKNDLDARLASLQTALTSFEDKKAQKPWADQVDKIAARARTAEAETGDAAKKDMFTVAKDALALLEKLEKAAFAQELSKPGGSKKLDDLVAGFGAETDDPVKQATCKAAIGARFNVDMEIPDGLSVKKLPQLYTIMASVPPEDVNNDKLKKLEYRSPDRKSTSYYNEKDAEIVLQQIPEAGGKSIYKRQDGSNAKEEAEYFNATTLHEIGHGVDAKFRIMETHQSAAGFGKWQKSSLDAAVTAFYTAFFAKYAAPGKATPQDLQLMVRTLITTGKCDRPAAGKPLASLLHDWDAISKEKAFVKDCAAIRTAANPWDKPVNVGGKVYIESYDNDWWQYDFAERAKGISDYQWRAPGEWFAEVYALWHLNKVQGFPDSIAELVKGKAKAA